MSTSARRRIGPETWSGRAGGREAGFWLRADRVEQDNQALRQERDGLIERIADQGEDRGDLSGASGAPGAVSSNDRFLRRHGDDAGGTRSVD